MIDESSQEALSQQQRDQLTTFQEITQISDEVLCIDILRESRWNVEEAVDAFVQGRPRGSSSGNVFSSSASTSSSSSALSSNSSSRSQNSNDRSRGNNPNAGGEQPNIIQRIFHPLKWLFQTVPVSLTPDLDSRKFIEEFESTYGSEHPDFVSGSYLSAISEAFRQSKFLLVYLHSPMHDDTNRFCSNVICSRDMKTFSDENLVVWIGSVWNPEAYGLSISLKTSSFPFLALLVCESERTVQIADKIQGYVDERQLLERLRNTIGTFRGVLERVRSDNQQRSEATMLREQQDREYHESVEADRRNRERRETEEAEKLKLEEEARQRAELEEAIELSKQLDKEAAIARIRATLPAEPESTQNDVTMIRFQLPQGVKVSRRFLKTDPMQTVSDYLRIHFADSGSSVVNFAISTNYPKRQLDDLTTTVEQEGLHPRGMLFVQDLDA